MSKAKKSQQLKRVQEAHFLLLQNVSYTRIVETLSTRYQMSERQIKRDIAEAKALFQLDDLHLKDQHALAYAQLQHVKAKALQNNNDDCVLRCLKMEKELREEYRSAQAKTIQPHTQPTLPDTVVQALHQPEE